MVLDRTGLALGQKEVKINGTTISIKTEIGDVRKYLKDVQRQKDNDDSDKVIDVQFDFLEKIISQGNPDDDKNIIKQLVEEYFQDLIKECLIALRLTTRKQLKDSDESKQIKN